MLGDQSGLYADLGGPGAVQAARMAVADAGGKVAGMPIEIVVGDHQNKADVGAAIARRWWDVENVDVIVDLGNSSVAAAINALSVAKKKAVLIASAPSSSLTGRDCSPWSIQWTHNTYALAEGTAKSITSFGAKSWFFITVDYTFGHALQNDASAAVSEAGGKTLGVVRHPIGSSDFSSYLLQAQAMRPDVIGFANTGGDVVNAVKQAREFGLTQSGIKLAALLMELGEVKAAGIENAQGLYLTEAYYWDRNDASRQWAKKYFDAMHKMPNMNQAGLYSALTHYLKAVESSKNVDAETVIPEMRRQPVADFFAENGYVREDGQFVHDYFLFQVKSPAESKSEWDLYKFVKTIPATEAYAPIERSACPFVKRN